MAIDLHTSVVDTSLPQKKHDEEDDDDDDLIVTLHNHNHSPSSGLKPHVLIPQQIGSKIRTSSTLPRYREEQGIVISKDEEFVAELTRRMTHLMLQQGDDKFIFSGISSRKSERSWDSSMGSPQSTLWSNLSSSLGSPEGSSKEPSSPPWNSRESRRESTQDAFRMLEKMRMGERSGNSSYHHHHHRSNRTSVFEPQKNVMCMKCLRFIIIIGGGGAAAADGDIAPMAPMAPMLWSIFDSGSDFLGDGN